MSEKPDVVLNVFFNVQTLSENKSEIRLRCGTGSMKAKYVSNGDLSWKIKLG